MINVMDEQNQWLTITFNFPDHRGNYNHQQYGKGGLVNWDDLPMEKCKFWTHQHAQTRYNLQLHN